MSTFALAMIKNAEQEMELAKVLCEWDQPVDACRCAKLPPDDEARCKSPIGIARVLLGKYSIQAKT